jgi:hypothetical protein
MRLREDVRPLFFADRRILSLVGSEQGCKILGFELVAMVAMLFTLGVSGDGGGWWQSFSNMTDIPAGY